MSVLVKARQRLVSLLLSSKTQSLSRRLRQLKRRWLSEEAVVQVYLRLDDPYSLLLVRRLPLLAQAYSISFHVHLIDEGIPAELNPDAARLESFARADAAMIAAVSGENFDAADELVNLRSGARALLSEEIGNSDGPADLDGVLRVFEAYWGGDQAAIEARLKKLDSISLEKSRQMHRDGVTALIDGGHFRPATLQFEGEWYWGIDRLHFLLSHLDAQGLARAGRSEFRVRLKSDIDKLNPVNLSDAAVPEGQILDVYFSFRSPYSYLALRRLQELQNTRGLQLRLRPVLPMVKRGLQVPRSKRIQIVKDTAREARRYDIPFGKIVDPLDAVEELLGLFVRADASDCAMRFSLAVLSAAWAGGIDLSDQCQRAQLMREHGLALSTVCNKAQLEAGLALAKTNRERLTALDLWGVPSFQVNGQKTWGQDRLLLLLKTAANEEALD